MGLEMSSMADLFNPPLSIDTQIMDNLQQTLGDPASTWNCESFFAMACDGADMLFWQRIIGYPIIRIFNKTLG